MRGALNLCRCILVGIFATALIVSPLGPFLRPVSAAPGPLDIPYDKVWSNLPSFPHILHEIYFVLPTNAAQITPSDWVLVDMPNYYDFDINSIFTVGNLGSPTFSMVGTTLRITNFSLLPGMGMTITSFFATNPIDGAGNQVTISIAEDQNGVLVRNQATIIPNESGAIVQVSATIISPMSALSVNGYTAANAFCTLLEDEAVVATTVADGLGYFVFNLTAVVPGAHTYKVSATDSLNRSTAQTTLNLFLLPNYLTTASGILLSSTLAIDKTEIDPGEVITFAGGAKPNSQINVFVESPLRAYLSQSNAEGNWTYELDHATTLDMVPGEYRVYTVVQDSVGNQSIVGKTISFRIKTPEDVNPPPSCDISHGDLNCDGRVNLTDFSILLYHWNTNHKLADINGDGKVNLTDFSIMMYYYSR